MTNQTHAPVLRAMAMNYSGKHTWDHLDAEACRLAADEITQLRARIAQLKAQAQPAREPLMPDVLADSCEAWLQAGGATNIVDAYEAGYRACERARGTTKEKQG